MIQKSNLEQLAGQLVNNDISLNNFISAFSRQFNSHHRYQFESSITYQLQLNNIDRIKLNLHKDFKSGLEGIMRFQPTEQKVLNFVSEYCEILDKTQNPPTEEERQSWKDEFRDPLSALEIHLHKHIDKQFFTLLAATSITLVTYTILQVVRLAFTSPNQDILQGR